MQIKKFISDFVRDVLAFRCLLKSHQSSVQSFLERQSDAERQVQKSEFVFWATEQWRLLHETGKRRFCIS